MNNALDCRGLVDPELVDLLEEMPTVEITSENLAALRVKWLEPVKVNISEAAKAVTVSKCGAKGMAGAPDVPLRIYRPAQSRSGVGCVLHIHGGGYVGGDSASLEPHHRAIAAELGCVLVAVDYRLAPETRFPGNLDDCYAGLAWVFTHSETLGVDPCRIGVMGESAGGGLAAALSLVARDRRDLKLAFQHLIYPMLDDRTGLTTDQHRFTGKFVWTAQNNQFGWSALLGESPHPTKNVSAYAAPARATDLAGLPKTFISIGALDLFLEENIEFARRLSRAGVPVELHVYPGAIHDFDRHPTAKVASDARRDSMSALARALGRPPASLTPQ